MEEEDAIQQFVDLYNSIYTTTISNYTDINDIIEQITSSRDAIEALYEMVIDVEGEDVFENLQKAFFRWIGNIRIKDIFQIFIPQINTGINNINVGIQFSVSTLRKVDKNTGIPLKDTNGDYIPSILIFNVGHLTFSTKEGFNLYGENSFNIQPSEIGETGLIINFSNLKADLSRSRNIPEAVADGRPTDFVGVYVTDATITLPPKWFKQESGTTGQIYARNLLVGTGGVSGHLGLEAVGQLPPDEEPELQLKLGSDSGFALALNRFNVEFQQNAIISTDIKGSITIPNFKKKKSDGSGYDDELKLGIQVHFDNDGDFSITASPDEEHSTFGIAGVFDFHLNSFTVGQEDDRYFLALSGELDVVADLGSLDTVLPKGLEIQKLIIWEDGSFEIATDMPPLPQEFRAKFGPVELYVSNIHLGSYEKEGRPYKYIGFDGGVDTNPTSVDAKGTGIKLYFSVDNQPLDVFLRLQRIDVDLILPANSTPETANLILKGYLAVRDGANNTTEYAGGVQMALPKLNLRGSAAMRLNPKRPSFIVDVEVETKKGIPLGTTGLSIYGFRGLVGNNFVAEKSAAEGVQEEDPWWAYYKSLDPVEGIHVEKFNDKDGFSLGAGVSLETSADNGKAFYSKLFFLLSLPNVFLFEGKAGILKKQNGFALDDEPPFFALLSVDDSSIQAALGVDYKMPEDGELFKKIARLYGVLEMGFFWGNSSAWYVNVGRDLPEDMRVQARIGELFDAYAYLMLSSKEIKIGAGASFGDDYQWPEPPKKGIVDITLTAYIDIAAKISFQPKQFGGSLALGGTVGVSLWGFGANLSADALLAGETPKPYIIIGKVGVAFRAFGKNWGFDIELEWTKDPNPSTEEIPLMKAPQNGTLPVQATNILTKTQYPLLYHNASSNAIPALTDGVWGDSFDKRVIPLDSFIDFEFNKGVKPFKEGSGKTKIGGVTTPYNNTEVFPPQRVGCSKTRVKVASVFVAKKKMSPKKTSNLY